MLLLNEWRYCWCQPVVKVCLVLMPLLAFMLGGDVEPKEAVVKLHYVLITLLMLGLPLLVGVLSPMMLLRDSTANMSELIDSTPINRQKRLLLGYVALVGLLLVIMGLANLAVIAAFSLSLSSSLGFSLSFWFNSSPDLLLAGGVSFVLLVIPGVMFNIAVVMWITSRFQSAMVLYVWMGAWGMGYLMLASMAGSPILAGSSVISDGFLQTMLWLDPYGISPMQQLISAQTAEFSQILLSKSLLQNRLLYIGLSALMVFGVVHFARASVTAKPVKIDKRTANERPIKHAKTFESVVMQLFTTPLLALLKHRVTQLILGVWPLLIFNEVVSGSFLHDPQVASQLNSIDALNLVAFDMLPVLGAFIIALWSWFICWLEKRYDIDQLIGATPATSRQLILAQIFALSFMTVLLLVLTFVGTSIAQLIVGSEIVLTHFLVQLTLSGLPLLLLGALFVCIHHLCRSQAGAGVVVLLVLIVKFTPITTAFGLTHTLWNIADTPLQEADNYWGYGASLSVYLPYMSVWILVTIAIVLLAIDQSHRGTSLGRLSFKKRPKQVVISLGLAGIAGLSLHFAMVTEKPLTYIADRDNWQAQYQAKYGHWQYKPQPSIVAIESHVDIYPHQQMAQFKLRFWLKNTTDKPIEQVLIGRYGNYDFGDISFAGTELADFDAQLNQGIYQLTKPLNPGEQTEMTAEFSYNQPKLWPYRSHQVVKPNFSYLRVNPLLPVVGYQHDYLAARQGAQLAKVMLHTIISTQKDHYALSQGRLVRTWQSDVINQGSQESQENTNAERTYFEYKTDGTINQMPTWLSVPHAPVIRKLNGPEYAGIKLAVYAPKGSKANGVHLDAMKDTIKWFTQNIAPYPGAQLSLFAKPDVGAQGYALPQVILTNHTASFRMARLAKLAFDQRYQRTVYHSAQQWFMIDNVFWSQVIPRYIELILIEKRYGKKAMEQMVAMAQEQLSRELLKGGSRAALVDVGGELTFDHRATLAFAKLRSVLGDEVIIEAIKLAREGNRLADGRDFVKVLKGLSDVGDYEVIDEVLLGGGEVE